MPLRPGIVSTVFACEICNKGNSHYAAPSQTICKMCTRRRLLTPSDTLLHPAPMCAEPLTSYPAGAARCSDSG